MQQATHLIVAGGGIAGLSAALALARAGLRVTVLEQAEAISEVGAGLQLGPNAVRVLDALGLLPALARVAAEPACLRILDAADGRQLGRLALGAAMRERYGWANYTLRRADLQDLLLQAVREQGGTEIVLGQVVSRVEQAADGQVAAHTDGGRMLRADGLIGCDGLWSRVRQHLRQDGPPRATGHVAWRALLAAGQVPAGVARDQTTVWVAPRLHAVAYPVLRGELFNVVLFTHAADMPGLPDGPREAADWDLDAERLALRQAVSGANPAVRALVEAAPSWRRWMLHDRPALLDPRGYAAGRVALAGDAAHPMRPHLAQGAAMAIEDAWTLGRVLHEATPAEVPAALARYAEQRWRRNARVQLRAQFNGMVMQASGPLRWGRDLAMAVRGEKLLDMPWLYGFRA
ncbi:MAG: FAD-dependent monooxygenase [Comamonas sp.]